MVSQTLDQPLFVLVSEYSVYQKVILKPAGCAVYQEREAVLLTPPPPPMSSTTRTPPLICSLYVDYPLCAT